MKISRGAYPLVFPMPAFLVGTYDESGKPNIMTAAWGGIASSEPPCVSVGIRPSRWTHAGILKRKAFTISIPDSKMDAVTDYVGIVGGKNHDKFAETGLTPVRSELIDAPYVAEAPVVVECELYNSMELGSHTLFIGRIVDVKYEEGLTTTGAVGLDMAKVDPLLYNSDDHYYRVGEQLGKGFAIGKTIKR